MALKKTLQFNNIEANYWRIVGFNVSITGEMAQIFLVGYKDEVARTKKLNVISTNYMIQNDKFNKYITVDNGTFVSDLYNYLKNEVEDFNGAIDI